MRLLLSMSLFLGSCYTVTQKPDYDFINQIKQQTALDSGLKTSIELNPAKVSFGKINASKKITGFFFIKNKGNRNFNLSALKANCACLETDYTGSTIMPNDSLKINYQLNLKNKKGYISNTIVAIGNCPFGNLTFLMEGSINNN